MTTNPTIKATFVPQAKHNIMKSTLLTVLLSALFLLGAAAQTADVQGILIDDTDTPVAYANVVLYSGDAMLKVETTDDAGVFRFRSIAPGSYRFVASYIGLDDYVVEALVVVADQATDMGKVTMQSTAVQLETATVTAQRAIVEIKPDRTVFNVQGTINSTGDNGLGLLRKAPGVLVDNNDNITVLGRSGVLVYIDGKRLPLAGDELRAYLENLQADQIDKMDIITNPGAKYEAQGNAGIIDIRLKKDKSLGSNGTIGGTVTQGRKFRSNMSSTGNYRNKQLNTFGSLGYNKGENINVMMFENFQNGLLLVEENDTEREFSGVNYRWGTDFFVAKNHTVGFLVSGNNNSSEATTLNTSDISLQSTPMTIDSVLRAENENFADRDQATYNLNYAYKGDKSSVNIDLDYGDFDNVSIAFQPNRYFTADTDQLLTENITRFSTPSNIDIITAKLDYEVEALGGQVGAGTKYSKVKTDNIFAFFNVIDGIDVRNDSRSNKFVYDENVTAGYLNYARSLSQKVSISTGLRVEHTDATGDLMAFDGSETDPVQFNYVSFFPSAGVTYTPSRMHTWSANYGRRINRPDYNVLNPFEEQLSELSFSKGNPFLSPEIVNNIELGYTYAYRYNFKLAFSRTTDQITRLIGPDDRDPRAGFISWENLATQDIVSFNFSAPITVKEWWNVFFNASANYLDNQADYGENGVVDVQAFSYNLFQQSTFTLGRGYTGEISGWFSGPGVWGGVFEFDSSYSLNLGLQKKFFNDNLNVRLSANDVTFQSFWSGEANFNGLRGVGQGNWDSRFVSLSLNYKLGNNNVKSRKRKTGIEAESKRVGSGE